MEKKRKKPSEKRHKELTPEELKMIEEEKDEINMKKATKWAVNILGDFLYLKQKNTDLETYSVVMLNDTLYEFFSLFRLAASTVWQVVMTTVSSCSITFQF